MRQAVKIFDSFIGWIEDACCIVLFTAIICIMVAHVFLRYVMMSGLMWTDELVQILLVFMVIFGSARAIRTNGHTELTGLSNMLPEKPRWALRFIVSMICVAFFILLFAASVQYVTTAGRIRTVVLRIPRAYCYASMAIGAAFMLYEFIKTIKHRVTHAPEEDGIMAELPQPTETAQ